MEKIKCVLWLLMAICAACSTSSEDRVSSTGVNSTGVNSTESRAVYIADWNSLAAHTKEPEWFKDAKLGIYFHWGVYSVPAFDSEWYPRWMYIEGLGDTWGGGVYQYHKDTFGPVSEFNYHDFIPMFKANEFDAEEWSALFKRAGATFAGPVAQHHDGFAMWGSDVNPWNVRDMGPQKDITDLLFNELKKSGMKTIATFHHARLRQRYADSPDDWADRGVAEAGWNSHYPYHPDLITSTTDPKPRKLYGNLPEQEFNDYWLAQVDEVVDKYAPDIIWFDSWLDQIPEDYRKKMVAHHFNQGVSRNQETLVAYKQQDLPANVGILDIEQGGKTDISEDYWLTDITISHGSWCYTNNLTYKEPSLIIRNMIDVWSKKGIVLLNVSPKADGVIPEAQKNILLEIGAWIARHKEAVYKTRVYSIYGYGEAEFEAGHFGGQSATIKYGKNDIRFAVSSDEKALFVYVLGLPEANARFILRHIFDNPDFSDIKRVSVVGSGVELAWSVKERGLELVTPAVTEMNEIATVFKVEFNE